MITTYDKFTRLLQIEIESLHDEIELILKSLDQRLAAHEITDYVRNENGAVLRNELMGLEDSLQSLGTEENPDASLDEIAETIKSYLHQRLAERDYVPCLYALLEQRIDRIVDYLRTPVHG